METIKDIVDEMRERAEAMEIHGTPHGIKVAIQHFADRIEKAYTNCNQFKMREALELARLYISLCPEEQSRAYVKNGQIEMLYVTDVLKVISAALAEPPRNCDLYASRCDAWVAFRKKNQQAWYEDLHLNFPDWLFAEAKGVIK